MPLTAAQTQKLDQCRLVIEEAIDAYDPGRMIVAWSGGKDSTLLLYFIREYCLQRNLPVPPVLDIDQQDAFPEIVEFRNRLVDEWQLKLVMVRNNDFLDKVQNFGDIVGIEALSVANQSALEKFEYHDSEITWHPSSPLCSYLMKAVPVNAYLAEHNISLMFTGIRWDEHGSRQQETYFSPRHEPDHTRVHPLLHLSERDIWDITFALQIPFNGLYVQGYRSIDTRSGTRKKSDIPAWEQDLLAAPEREGRDEEKEKMMAQLRALGYM